MHPNALLDLATDLLRAVLRLDQPADGVISAFFRQHRALGARERHTLAETAYTVLRQRRCCSTWRKVGPAARSSAGWRSLPGRAATPSCAVRSARTNSNGWRRSPRSTAPRCRTSCATTCPTGSPARCASRSGPTTSGRW